MAEPGTAYWELIDPVWDIFNIYEGGEVFLQSTKGIARKKVLLFAAHFCLSEVRNGGFSQFFGNSTGVLAPEAIEGFEAVGMPRLAAVVQAAVLRVGEPYPRDRPERRARLHLEDLAGAQDKTKLAFSEELGMPVYRDDSPKVFADLNKELYRLCNEENGGFDVAADRFATATEDA